MGGHTRSANAVYFLLGFSALIKKKAENPNKNITLADRACFAPPPTIKVMAWAN